MMRVIMAVSAVLLILDQSNGQTCSSSDDLKVLYGSVTALVVNQANLTTACPAGFAARNASVSGEVAAASASVSGTLSAAGVTAPVVSVTGSLSAPSVSASGTVSAARFAGAATQLTNLAAQPEFAAAQSTANVLSAANTAKTCVNNSAIAQIRPDGSYTCIPMAFMNGVTASACLTSADCSGGLVCDPKLDRCVGPAGYACTADAQCYSGLACTLNGLCSRPPSSCTAIKSAYPAAPSGVYLLHLPQRPGNPTAYFYCNMVSADGAGWTLAWSNVRGGTGKPHSQMTMTNAVNGIFSWPSASILNGFPSTTSNPLESFVVYTGLTHWQSLSPRGKIRYDWSADYGLPVAQSYECTYTYLSPPSYVLTLSACVQRVGSVVPGLANYHSGYNFYTADVDNGNGCSAQYSGTAFWYGTCWSGSIWGDGDIVDRGHSNAAYWTSSAGGFASAATAAAGTGGGNGWLYIS